MKHSEEFKFCNLYSSEFDENKDSILLIDENKAITNILLDDLKEIEKNYDFKVNDYNLIVVAGQNSALNFEMLYKNYKKLNIKYAIIGITSSGKKIINNETINLSGVDVYELLCKKCKNVKFMFFAQNINYKIKNVKNKIDKFKQISGKNLEEYVLKNVYKGSEQRQDEILNKLFI